MSKSGIDIGSDVKRISKTIEVLDKFMEGAESSLFSFYYIEMMVGSFTQIYFDPKTN
jgi:hypothetical protein